MWSYKSFSLRTYFPIAYLLPVILLIWFVHKFGVNIPFWIDEWELVSLFDKVASGTANFSDFFAQHNEHRMLFPKILFLILAFPSKWDIRLEMYFSIFLAIASFCAMYKIAANSSNQNQTIFQLFNISTCILAFSLVQYENWLWGFQIAWFFINLCVVLAVFFLVVPKLLPIQRLALSAICCFIASFSSAHGLLSWIALIPTVAAVEGSTKQRKIRLSLWIMLFFLSVAIYLIGYEKPSHHPDILFCFKNPLIGGTYLLTLLGTPMGKLIIPTTLVGLIVLLTFLLFNIHFLKKHKSELARDMAPWLSLGWFAILFALITTIGRAGFGVGQASSSRYTTVSILLVISLLQIWRLFIYHKRNWLQKNIHIIYGSVFLVGIFTGIAIANTSDAIAQGEDVRLKRTNGEACLPLVFFLDKSISEQPNNCLTFIFPSVAGLKELAEPLQRIGFRDFPRNITFTTQPMKVHGYIDTSESTDKPVILPRKSSLNSLKLSGWAILPEQQEQPKVVLLSYDGNKSFFANAVIRLDRPDIVKHYNSSLYQNSGWEVDVSQSTLPLGETVIKAWVYDSNSKQFVKLRGEQKIEVVK